MFRYLSCISITVALFLFSSCRTSYTASLQSDYYNAYVGHSHNEIVRSWGAPSRQASDGNGGTILIYEDVTQNTVASQTIYGLGYSVPSVTTNNYTSYVHFYINRNGQCYGVKTNHKKEWSEFSPGKTIGLIIGIAGGIGLLALLAADGEEYESD